MIENEVEELATEFVVKSIGRKLDLIGITRANGDPDEWNVLFKTTDAAGVAFDGPTIVIVNDATKQTRLFE